MSGPATAPAGTEAPDRVRPGCRAPIGDGLARHGVAGPRAQVANGGRYGRMFPERRWAPEERAVQDAIAQRLAGLSASSTDNLDVPAGYTYLGQFVDHDITFDPTSRLRRDNDLEALVDFRTPRLDLDSLYGSGPMDQAYMYDWETEDHRKRGVKLLVGHNADTREFAAEDLPRNQQSRALIGDPRNDENLVVSQLHLLFVRFHNNVVDWVAGKRPDLDSPGLFEHAQRIVRWHYQWVVMNDLLERIVGDEMARDVFHPGNNGSAPVTRRFFTRERFERPSRPFMPVEFSGAAFRFGHSMVRDDYIVNVSEDGVPLFVPIFRRAGAKDHLGGIRRHPAGLVIAWEQFFALTATDPQRSKLIDTSLARALRHLPPDRATLAELNVCRGQALGLPAGRDVAEAMEVEPLTGAELLRPLVKDGPMGLDEHTVERLAPLWYYVLCEAETLCEGKHLGPVGGRIVAEVLAGLLQDDPQSFLHEPGWKPELPHASAVFTMPDLVRFAERRDV